MCAVLWYILTVRAALPVDVLPPGQAECAVLCMRPAEPKPAQQQLRQLPAAAAEHQQLRCSAFHCPAGIVTKAGCLFVVPNAVPC